MATRKQKQTNFGRKAHQLTDEDREKSKKSVKRSKREIEQIREVFYKLQNGVTPHVREWLMQIAEGVPRIDDNNEIVRREDGSVVFESEPDPKGALDAFFKLSKFVIPELSAVKVEASVTDGKTTVKLPPWMKSNDDTQDTEAIVVE